MKLNIISSIVLTGHLLRYDSSALDARLARLEEMWRCFCEFVFQIDPFGLEMVGMDGGSRKSYSISLLIKQDRNNNNKKV